MFAAEFVEWLNANAQGVGIITGAITGFLAIVTSLINSIINRRVLLKNEANLVEYMKIELANDVTNTGEHTNLQIAAIDLLNGILDRR